MCDSCLYICVLGPRDCRCPSGAPGAGLWAVLGSPHAMTISSLFCSPNLTGACQRECLQANVTLWRQPRATNLATSTSAYTCSGRRAAPGPGPRGRAGGKPNTGIGQARPYRSSHGRVTPPAPAPVPRALPACGLPRPAGRVSHSPWAQARCGPDALCL